MKYTQWDAIKQNYLYPRKNNAWKLIHGDESFRTVLVSENERPVLPKTYSNYIKILKFINNSMRPLFWRRFNTYMYSQIAPNDALKHEYISLIALTQVSCIRISFKNIRDPMISVCFAYGRDWPIKWWYWNGFVRGS